MKINDLLTELRRNPDQNPRAGVYKTMTGFLPEYKNNIYVSFTSLDKLGINPKSDYDTPLGVYAYTMEYVRETTSGGADPVTELPFAGNQPYANIFAVKNPEGMLEISNLSDEDFNSYVDKLREYLMSTPAEYPDDTINALVKQSKSFAQVQSPGGRLWYVTMELAKYLIKNKYVSSNNVPVAWNKLFRSIDVVGVIDNGEGIIHENEPSQTVVFDPRQIQLLKRIPNLHASAVNYKQLRSTLGFRNKRLQQMYSTEIQGKTFNELVDYYLESPSAIPFIKDPKVRLAVVTADPRTIRHIKYPTDAEWLEYIKTGTATVPDIRRIALQKKLKKLINPIAMYTPESSNTMFVILSSHPELIFDIALNKLGEANAIRYIKDAIFGFHKKGEAKNRSRMNYLQQFVDKNGVKMSVADYLRVLV